MPSPDNVDDLLAQHQPDICLGETWLTLDISDSYLNFPGYVVKGVTDIHRERVRPGGVQGSAHCIITLPQ